MDEALQSHDRALAHAPGSTDALWNKSLVLLAMGRLIEGFTLFEHRKAHGFGAREIGAEWHGAPVAGQTLFLHAEQGFGDTLQFARYAHLLVARGAKVVLAAPKVLHPVLRTLGQDVALIDEGESPTTFDAHSALMSLPLAFGTTLDTIPSETPYLHAEPSVVARWRSRLGQRARPRVGLVWAGRPTHKNDRRRSIPLEMLKPLLDHRTEWISLQKEMSGADAALLAGMGARDFASDIADFGDTAALIALMDLVITVDTSVAHLAGAMGKPVWIFLPFNADWRWLRDRADSPWYPTARLFRQTVFGRWEAVLSEAKQALDEILSPH